MKHRDAHAADDDGTEWGIGMSRIIETDADVQESVVLDADNLRRICRRLHVALTVGGSVRLTREEAALAWAFLDEARLQMYAAMREEHGDERND